MKRGIVIATDRRTLTVMTPTGDVFNLPRQQVGGAARVGQEIRFEPDRRRLARGGLAGLAVAAALTLALLSQGWLVPTAAVLSLDINPTLELSLASGGRVLAATGFNPEGRGLVAAARPQDLAVGEAVERLALAAIAGGYLADGGTVVATLARRRAVADLDALQAAVVAGIDRAAQRHSVRLRLVTARADTAVIRAARGHQVSVGTFLVYQAAQAQGLALSLDALKATPVAEALAAAGARPEAFYARQLIAAPMAEQVLTGMVGPQPAPDGTDPGLDAGTGERPDSSGGPSGAEAGSAGAAEAGSAGAAEAAGAGGDPAGTRGTEGAPVSGDGGTAGGRVPRPPLPDPEPTETERPGRRAAPRD